MVATVGRVIRNEKFLGLWKGMTPSLIRCVPGVGIYFSSLHTLKSNFSSSTPGPLEAVCLGAVARCMTVVIMIPVTVIKTRYESGVYHYKSIGGAVNAIYTKEGLRGLTSGLLPTIMRDASFSGLYLMCYTQTKQCVPKRYLDGKFAPPVHFTCGVFAGLMASAITQPFDVIKTKMQLYPNKFDSFSDVFVYVYKKYGVKGYFKGLAPRVLRRTLMAAMAWTVYEEIMKVIGIK